MFCCSECYFLSLILCNLTSFKNTSCSPRLCLLLQLSHFNVFATAAIRMSFPLWLNVRVFATMTLNARCVSNTCVLVIFVFHSNNLILIIMFFTCSCFNIKNNGLPCMQRSSFGAIPACSKREYYHHTNYCIKG